MARNTAKGANITIEIRGYNRVRNALRRGIAAHPKETDEVMRRWAHDTRAVLKGTRYPPKPANSRYTRTGRLASSWKAERMKPGVWGITNNASGPKSHFYARYVVGDWQTGFHKRNGWWLADDIVEKQSMPLLRGGLEEMYVDMWNE